MKRYSWHLDDGVFAELPAEKVTRQKTLLKQLMQKVVHQWATSARAAAGLPRMHLFLRAFGFE